MKLLIIGAGGRENALVYKLAQSKHTEKIYAIPGNPGIAKYAQCINDIKDNDNDALVAFAEAKHIDLVVIGPEVPLVNGLTDALAKSGIAAFGPNRAAAMLEGSKSFAKDFMQKYAIPTARYQVFTDAASAKTYIEKEGAPIVIKADGLAAGKGVIVAQTIKEALAAIDEIMCDKAFGAAGNSVVIEECLRGEEASVLAFTDGKTIIPMIPAQDHKRALDYDKGDNTGGMGAYAPAPVIDEVMLACVQEEILEPVIAAMENEGRLYKGCLYAGLMITENGPKVIEFNARFGDPETQVILPLLKSDLVEIMLASINGTLDKQEIAWYEKAAVCVVLAAGGYPHSYRKGDVITGLEAAQKKGALCFQAGIQRKGSQLCTNGGRVLDVVAVDENIPQAIKKAYEYVSCINFNGKQIRHDIGKKALQYLHKA